MANRGLKFSGLPREKPILVLEPHGFALVKSHETFMLSEKVIGIFGQISDLARLGLDLANSPFIDPLFHGQLELGLWNRTAKKVDVPLGQRIGKVTFFDISDTYPVEIKTGSFAAKKFATRRPLRDDDPVHTSEE